MVKFCWMLTWSFPESTTVFATLKHATTFTCLMDPRLGTDFPYISHVMGGGSPPYNALAKIEVGTGTHEVIFPGPKVPGARVRLRPAQRQRGGGRWVCDGTFEQLQGDD
jgi:hypothetical protein